MGKPFGLAAASNEKIVFLPLESVNVTAKIDDAIASVDLTQTYSSHGYRSLSSARYLFPIPENAAVCAFKMGDGNGRTVTGIVEEKKEAKRKFERAVSNNVWAGLASQVTSDVFSISVGAIPSGQNITVTLTYVVDIPDDESEEFDQIRFSLPTYIGRRYGEAPSDFRHRRSNDKEAVFSFKADIWASAKILKVQSPSHPSNIVLQPMQEHRQDGLLFFTVEMGLRKPVKLDRDFVLSIQAASLSTERCIGEIDRAKNTVALLLTAIPRKGAFDIPSQEYIFVVDRSTSMKSRFRLQNAVEAVHDLLQELPLTQTYFNVVAFGGKYDFLWSRSRINDEKSRARASAFLDEQTATDEGTELGNALQWVFDNRRRDIPTAVFVFTDGKVWNTKDVIKSVRETVQEASPSNFLRIFSIGIGDAASTELCQGIAKVSNGVCYMTTTKEEISKRSKKLLRAAKTQPFLRTPHLTVDWGYDTLPRAAPVNPSTSGKGKQINPFDKTVNPLASSTNVDPLTVPDPVPSGIMQAPTLAPEFYPANRFLVSAVLSNTATGPKFIVLKGTLPGGNRIDVKIDVSYVREVDNTAPPLLHTITAKRLISELEDGDTSVLGLTTQVKKSLLDEKVESAIVQYGKQYSLASRFTSFVAIDENASDDSKARVEPFEEGDSEEEEDDGDEGGDAEGEEIEDEREGDLVDGESSESDEEAYDYNHYSRGAPPLNVSRGPGRPRTSLRPQPHPAPPIPIRTHHAVPGPENRLITLVALQSDDGSFSLDRGLLALLRSTNSSLSLSSLKDTIPSSIRGQSYAERVWGTVLAAAYMKEAFPNDHSTWAGSVERAQSFVRRETGTASFLFNQLLRAATAELKRKS